MDTRQDSLLHFDNIPEIKLDVSQLKGELLTVQTKCRLRGLQHSSKWVSELSFCLRGPGTPLPSGYVEHNELELGSTEQDTYNLAKSYFDLKEYDRAAFFTAEQVQPLLRFLHWYSRYLSQEKKRLDSLCDTVTSPDLTQQSEVKRLRVELTQEHREGRLDPWSLYVLGLVLRRLQLHSQAAEVLVEAVQGEPGHWGAWVELSSLITSREQLQTVQHQLDTCPQLANHWARQLFLAHTYLELQQNEQAVEIYLGLSQGGLSESTYIMAQVAIAFHNMRQVDQAVGYFKQLASIDPFRLDNLDTYSNLLYVKEQRVELAHLAHRTNMIDKYRPETCCVIGNYYSLRSQHEKAVVYFKRALKLSPGYLSALTLMGHEFMEMKNTHAAIQSYRQAIQVNRRDYRAWYGLGQTYEILKMPYYCLYYYKQAQELRPSDSRMLVALGESYEKLDKVEDAMKCFWKAHCVGDIEGGIALLKLARLYQRVSDNEQAAAAYQQYISDTEAQGIQDRDEQSTAYKFLAEYYLRQDMLNEAYDLALRCTEFPDVREDGKAILKSISTKRAQQASEGGESSVVGVGLSQGQAQTEGTGAGITALATRLRAQDIDLDSPADRSTNTPPRDFQPCHLNFTSHLE